MNHILDGWSVDVSELTYGGGEHRQIKAQGRYSVYSKPVDSSGAGARFENPGEPLVLLL